MFVVLLLLLAWGLRLCCLEEVPPGWRDDELINIHALSSQLLEGRFPIYYLGASGHEPLYHHLHAAVHALLGFNVLSGHILSVVFGMLSIALTYSLVRQLFPAEPATAALAAMTLATSFWSLMYSRTAVRHISLPPLALSTLYAFWRQMSTAKPTVWGWGLVGLLLGVTLHTYTASRLLPVLLAVFVGYLALFHRDRFREQWRGFAVMFVVMAVSAAPLGIAILQGRTMDAIEGVGADARVTELAGPLRDLRSGNPRPVLTSTARTLGMFHATGDPEWLYNISGRPVFNLLGGILLWAGVALCFYRWRQPRCFVLLTWLGAGLSPAFFSTPPASLGHTILAQPVVYILPPLALVEMSRWLKSGRLATVTRIRKSIWPLSAAANLALGAVVISNPVRDIRDYFFVWPDRGMVRLLYRADYREAADYLDANPESTDVAIGSGLMGPWDRIALQVDVEREDVAPRLFNPERALVWAGVDDASMVLLPSWPKPIEPIEAFLGSDGRDTSSHLVLHTLPSVPGSHSLTSETRFANGLTLTQVRWVQEESLVLGGERILLTAWRVSDPLDLPRIPIVAQPPPPKTYSGPRLAVFVHLVSADGKALDIDDGLWVDPLTLQPGDRFIQIHRLVVPRNSSAERYALELGLYDPKTNRRWAILKASGEPEADLVHIPVGDQP